MKKPLAILALAATMLTASCAEPPTLMEFMPMSSDKSNFGGTTITWSWKKGTSSQAYYDIGTPQYDILMDRIDSIEKELNVNIEAVIDESKVNMDAIKSKMMSGTPGHDLITTGDVSEFAVSKLVYPLSDLTDYIDLNDSFKFGPKTAQEGSMYNGKVYALSPVQWPGFEPMGAHLIAYNRDLFRTYGLTDLHEYYENEVWTYDTFEKEFFEKVDIKDSEGNPIKLFLTHESNLYQALIHSNQVKFIKKRDDGTLAADPYSGSFVNAMVWGEKLVDTYRKKINFEDTFDIESYRYGYNLTALTYTAAFTTGNIAYNDLGNFESGIMPFPCGPDATYGEWTSCVVHIYGFMIPITSVNVEATATVLNKLAEPFEEFGGQAGLLDYYKSNIFMNDLDAEIYVEVSKNTSYTYSNVADQSGAKVRQQFQDALYESTETMSYAMEKYRNKLTELIEEWMIPNYTAVYGE